MQIRIISVGDAELKQGKKAKYSEVLLTFSVDGKEKTRKIFSFNKEIYPVLTKALPGEVYDIKTEKNGEYWDWVSAMKVEGGVGASAASASGGGSKWETPEERAMRQVYIIRQSSMASAVNAVGPGKGVQEYLDMAKAFEAFVMGVEQEFEPTEEGVV